MDMVSAASVESELRRVAGGLEEAEALVDAAGRQVGGVLHLQRRLVAARQSLDRAGVVIAAAQRAERSENVSLPRTFAWTVPLPFAFMAAGLAVDQPVWVAVTAWVCTYVAVAVAGHVVTSTVVRGLVHRREVRRTQVPGPAPSDAGVPADELGSSPTAYRRAQALMRSRNRHDSGWRAKVRLGEAVATVVGVPGPRYLPEFRPASVLPAVQQLVADIDILVHELDRRPFGRRAADHGVQHYLRARAALVHTYRDLAGTAEEILTTAEQVTPRRVAA